MGHLQLKRLVGFRTLSQLKRPDGLELRHWKREDNLQSNYLVLSHSPNGRIEESGIDNRFDKFGVAPDIVAYSEQEYTMHLQDQSWTREETDYLFSLYREFDARCVVIADRYEFPSKPRTLEVRDFIIQRMDWNLKWNTGNP